MSDFDWTIAPCLFIGGPLHGQSAMRSPTPNRVFYYPIPLPPADAMAAMETASIVPMMKVAEYESEMVFDKVGPMLGRPDMSHVVWRFVGER